MTEPIDETAAADGHRRYPAVTTLTDLVFMLNDGAFNMNSTEKLGELAEKLEELGCDTGKKQRGSITLTIEVEREHDGVYFFTPALKIKLPTEKVGRTIGWVTNDNRFTPNKPGQGNLFGTVREINIEARAIREA